MHVWLLVFCCEKEVLGGVVHTDIVDGEGEPHATFEDGNRGTRLMGFRRRAVTWPEVVKEETVLPNLLQWDLSFRDAWDGERCCSKI